MNQPVFTLDHAGVAVRDLDAAEAAYRRLGFNLTPRSIHSGAVEPGGPVVPWGSGNHCAMFADGYLEVVGLTGASVLHAASGDLHTCAVLDQLPRVVKCVGGCADNQCGQGAITTTQTAWSETSPFTYNAR